MGFPKFTIKKDNAGEFRFNLYATNGQDILRSSEGYSSKQGCKGGIESVKKNSQDDSKFKREESSNGKFYFNLVAGNGEKLGISEMYERKQGMENGISSVMKNAPDAEVEDLTA